ncbi:MAG: type IV secretory system conjugative DNA transfer family protein [Selenomonadaceae bacterium]|nr:type IV secretory system conjugative DNA transfer family protein [Selenomonadaceae bacterium]
MLIKLFAFLFPIAIGLWKAHTAAENPYMYAYLGFLGGLLLLYAVMPKKRLSSHGTAHWGEKQDISDMDLISASGVVVGLYDNNLTRACTAFLRAVESTKKDVQAQAEMDFDQRQEKAMDRCYEELRLIRQKLPQIKEKSLRTKIKKREAVLQNYVEHPPKYDPKKEDFWTVYPFVWFHKNLQGILRKQSHFYLRDNSNKHLAVVAPTRSGKGVGLIIPTLLGGWKESVIVNDIKSENWGVTAGYRKRMGQTVIKFEPTAEDGSSARWNPLEEIPIGTAGEVSAAQNLAYILANYEGKEKLDHWGANAATVITVVILHLLYAHYSDPVHYPHMPSLYSVAAFMKANVSPELDENGNPVMETQDGEMVEKVSAKGFLETLKSLQGFEHVPDEGIDLREWDKKREEYVTRHFTPEDMVQIYPEAQSLQYMPNTHPIIYQNFVEILSKPENECGSIISTANTALKEYLDPTLAQNTSVSDFSIDDIMNYRKPVSLYLVTPPSDLLRLAPIFRLFFEMMVKHHARKIGTYENGVAKTIYKHKCLFLMDEFSSLGNLQSFAATLSYIAGYGMKVFLINQGLPQINGIYGKDNQILMNCHLQIFYAPNDNDTGKYAESLMGNETIQVESESSNGGIFAQKNYSKSETGRALITADEIKRLGDKEIIVASGSPPILTDKVKYYENEFFTSKLMDAPVVSDVIRDNPNPARERCVKELEEQKAQQEENRRNFHFTYKQGMKSKARDFD